MKNNVSELKKIYKKMDKEKERDSFTSQKKISSKHSNHGNYSWTNIVIIILVILGFLFENAYCC